MKLVIIESPFFGEIERNIIYAQRAMADSLKRGEVPFLSHLLYTQVLDDTDPIQRQDGIQAGLEWGKNAEMTIVYNDYGISPGMEYGIDMAKSDNRQIIYRKIGKNNNQKELVKAELNPFFFRTNEYIKAIVINNQE